MTLLDTGLVLVVVGLLMWLTNAYIPMAAGIKSILNVVVFVVVLIGCYRFLDWWDRFQACGFQG
jgi:hypothetical protein